MPAVGLVVLLALVLMVALMQAVVLVRASAAGGERRCPCELRAAR